MYESDLVEGKDFGFNHYIHHFDECEIDALYADDEYETTDSATEYVDEMDW